MFEKPEDALDWGENRDIVALCPKHKKPHDIMIECPDCKRDKKPDIFKNVVRSSDQKPV